MKTLPELSPIAMALPPTPDDDILATAKWIDLKDAKGLYVIVPHFYGGNTNLVVRFYVGATAAGTTDNTFSAKWWKAADTATSHKLVRQTDATTHTINTSASKNQFLVAYVDAAQVAAQVAGGRYIKARCTGGHADSRTAVLYQVVGARYQGVEVTPTLS